MFVLRVRSKGKDGKTYLSVLLRESKRVGQKVISHTLAVLTHLPDWLIGLIERAVEEGKDASSLQELVALSNSRLGLRSELSFGAVYLVHEMAKLCGIPKALGPSQEAKLALWQVLARTLSPSTSLLGIVRLAGHCSAPSLLDIQSPFNEDDLYANGAWIEGHQSRVEARLWQARPKSAANSDGLFLYDVTSSYFEGTHNALGDFGYNRDQVRGKHQVIMGLLTDAQGEPVSVSLFPGNTSDLSTFKTQVDHLKNTFKQSNVTLVGDRGMIRGPQQKEANAAGFHYISALHKAEIETLLRKGEVQRALFDKTVQETLLQDGRRLVTRCNPVRREELKVTRQGFRDRMATWITAANVYLKEHPRAKESTQLKLGTSRLQRGKLNVWITLQVKDRALSLVEDLTKLEEHAKLDGCYAIVSDLPAPAASQQVLHDRYKDLAKVESDFRTLKHGHLEIRPWFVQREDNTRAHAFTAMLALKIRRRLQRAWEPLNLTVEEGLAELEKLCVMELYETNSGQSVSRQLPTPNELQAKLLQAAEVKMPPKAPAVGPTVVTRVDLSKRRKSAQKA